MEHPPNPENSVEFYYRLEKIFKNGLDRGWILVKRWKFLKFLEKIDCNLLKIQDNRISRIISFKQKILQKANKPACKIMLFGPEKAKILKSFKKISRFFRSKYQ